MTCLSKSSNKIQILTHDYEVFEKLHLHRIQILITTNALQLAYLHALYKIVNCVAAMPLLISLWCFQNPKFTVEMAHTLFNSLVPHLAKMPSGAKNTSHIAAQTEYMPT